MKKFDLSAIMCKAWKLYRKGVGSFAEALHRAWNSAKAAPINAQRIEEAQQAAGHRTSDGMDAAVGTDSHHAEKGSVSGGAYPQQQGGRPNLQGIILRRFSGQTTTL